MHTLEASERELLLKSHVLVDVLTNTNACHVCVEHIGKFRLVGERKSEET